jgi:FtsP/CotA-like multicopper oxidase with cupredoxin domain
VFTVNGEAGPDVPMLTFEQGAPVLLRVKNEIGPYHPFHLHGQFFQIVTRNGEVAAEPGLKDTVLLDSMEEVTLLTYFENPGEWMYHCHIPEHAELGMMGHLMVTAKP